MSSVVEIYGKKKNGTNFFIIDSPETEVSGNLTVLKDLDISGILKINNLDVSGKLSQIDASLVDLESSSGGGGSVLELNDLTDVAKDAGKFNLVLGSALVRENQRNTIVGVHAGGNNTSGEACTYIGSSCGRYNSSSYNVAMGHESLSTGNGDHCVAIGYQSSFQATGANNTSIGSTALYHGTGNNNVAIGNYALKGNEINGSNNIAIGYCAHGKSNGMLYLTGSNNIIIGANTEATSTSVSNEITLGNDDNTLFRIPGLDGSNGQVLTYDNGYINFASVSGSGGGTAVFFSATSDGERHYNIVSVPNGGTTAVTNLSPDNYPGEDNTQENCNSSGINWTNGVVTIPTTGVYAIQMGIFFYDYNFMLLQCAVILERQKVGESTWLKQTEEGYVNYGDGSVQEDYTSRHVVGTFMGKFNEGDKLRISGFAYSRATNPEIKLIKYRSNTSYLRGHMIHAL